MGSDCTVSYDGQWLTKCLDTLDKINIVWDDFSDGLLFLLILEEVNSTIYKGNRCK